LFCNRRKRICPIRQLPSKFWICDFALGLSDKRRVLWSEILAC
jgi:hypothetical protein